MKFTIKFADFAPKGFVQPDFSCRKQAFESRGMAESAIRSLYRRGLHRPEDGSLHTYKCGRCQKWHTGHTRES